MHYVNYPGSVSLEQMSAGRKIRTSKCFPGDLFFTHFIYRGPYKPVWASAAMLGYVRQDPGVEPAAEWGG